MKTRYIATSVAIACSAGIGYVTAQALHQSTPPVPTPVVRATPRHSAQPPLATMSQPTHFSVPVIGLSAPIQQVGLTKAGDMEVPLSETTLGWYQGGAYPGNPGPAVLAGHTGYPDKPAPFRKLEQLKKGDAITIEDVVGHKATFTVTETALYTPDTAPRERIFGPTSHAQLVVITCTGTWIPRAQTYSHRLVIYSIRTS